MLHLNMTPVVRLAGKTVFSVSELPFLFVVSAFSGCGLTFAGLHQLSKFNTFFWGGGGGGVFFVVAAACVKAKT